MITRKDMTGNRGACFSPCERYRYQLWRSWATGPRMVVLGINPSTASEVDDDPTIRRCVRFARDAGFGGLVMVNLFAWRSVDVNALAQVDDPIGPENDALLDAPLAEDGSILVWATGSPKKVVTRLQERFRAVRERFRSRSPFALSLNQDGWPGHPLYLAASCRPFRWEIPDGDHCHL